MLPVQDHYSINVLVAMPQQDSYLTLNVLQLSNALQIPSLTVEINNVLHVTLLVLLVMDLPELIVKLALLELSSSTLNAFKIVVSVISETQIIKLVRFAKILAILVPVLLKDL